MEDVKLDTRFLPWFFTQVVILFIRKSWVDWWTELILEVFVVFMDISVKVLGEKWNMLFWEQRDT